MDNRLLHGWLVTALLLPACLVALAQGVTGESVHHLAIEMRDGARLATDLYLPEDYSPERHPRGVPAVLVCTPYDKSRAGPLVRWRACFIRNGYAFAVQDMRGFHASAAKGTNPARHDDGYDTVEWLARQPWCNGKIGMLGHSHLGAVQYETAMTQPPHLACAIPAQAPGNYYTNSLFPAVFRKADMETILRGAFNARTRHLIQRRIRSQRRSQLERFNTPMIHSAGWFDFYKEGAIEMFRALREHGGPEARTSQQLLIGPWGHGVLQEEAFGTPLTLPGGMTYPANARLNWETEVWLPWFDYWCKDTPTGVPDKPVVRYYLMGDVSDPDAPGNTWVEADDFPPKATAVAYYVHADHTLRREEPVTETASLEYTFDPSDPAPTVGRRHVRQPVTGPHDQREMENRPDVMVFTTAALETPLQIVGQIRVRLWASSDRTDTDFTAMVTDVYPDGRSIIIADGIVKARYRNGFLTEDFLTPGEAYEFAIDLGYTAIVLAPGHRLRLNLSSSNFDRFDINPNTGEPYGDHAVTRDLLARRFRAESSGEPEYTAFSVARNTIYANRLRATAVMLPLISAP